jgi:hypothetical protein
VNEEVSATYPLLLNSVVSIKVSGEVLVGVAVTTVDDPLITAVQVT